MRTYQNGYSKMIYDKNPILAIADVCDPFDELESIIDRPNLKKSDIKHITFKDFVKIVEQGNAEQFVIIHYDNILYDIEHLLRNNMFEFGHSSFCPTKSGNILWVTRKIEKSRFA